MPDGVGHGQVQAVMCRTFHVQRAAHFKTKTSAKQDKRNISKRMVVAFTQFIGPHDGGIVEQAAIAARFGYLGQAFSQVGQFTREPFVDSREFVERILVFVRLVG